MTATITRASAPVRSYLYHVALQARASGVSVVPMRTDGSKQPALYQWHTYQQRHATLQELECWFHDGQPGLAFITGAISGNLEALDFDCRETFESWLRQVCRDQALSALWERVSWGYMEATPSGGRHILYRCDQIEGNQKLACRRERDGWKTLIETRGEGGLLIVAPSRGNVHPSRRSYTLLRGSVLSIQTILASERASLFSALRAFDERPSSHTTVPGEKPQRQGTGTVHGQRPGDLFNQRACWEEILLPHGWKLVRTVGEAGYWKRPGKQDPGISATTNYQGADLLYVFSTSTLFEAERGYTKFHAYALLEHHGDFSAAARDLYEQGYRSDTEAASRKAAFDRLQPARSVQDRVTTKQGGR